MFAAVSARLAGECWCDCRCRASCAQDGWAHPGARAHAAGCCVAQALVCKPLLGHQEHACAWQHQLTALYSTSTLPTLRLASLVKMLPERLICLSPHLSQLSYTITVTSLLGSRQAWSLGTRQGRGGVG